MRVRATPVDIRAEPALTSALPFVRPAVGVFVPRGGFLVTGANSYLGVHVLRELLDRGLTPVHALLRGDGPAHARERIREAASRWGLPPEGLDRVEVHVGEVTREGWEMPAAERERLAEAVGHVFHFALLARYDVGYPAYRETWLPELLRMIAWCGGERPKALHYPGSYNTHFLRGDDDFRRIGTSAWLCGYTGFKWVAQALLARALAAGLPGAYYDIPLVLGSVARGRCPRTYSAILVLDAFLRAGVGIDVGRLRVLPVDALARVMVQNATAGSARVAQVRPVLSQPFTFEDVATALAELGIPLAKTTWADFVSRRKTLRQFIEWFVPADLAALVTQTHEHPAVFPAAFDVATLPATLDVVRANCRALYGAARALAE